MTKARRKQDLVNELLRLAREHSPEEWSHAAATFQSVAEVARTIERDAASGKFRHVNSARPPRKADEDVRGLLQRLSLAQLREVTLDLRLPWSVKDSRGRLISRLLGANKNAVPVLAAIKRRTSAEPTGALVKWSDIIMGKNRA